MEGLLPEEYQAVVAPAMEAVSHLAAARGDPYLYNDLPCMLTLMVLVRDLAELYQDQWGALGQLSSAEEFAAAPLAACAMVLDEFEVDADSIKTMLRALDGGFRQLIDDQVFGAERLPVQRAWDAALGKNPEQQRACLRQAAAITTAAIDRWEHERAAPH